MAMVVGIENCYVDEMVVPYLLNVTIDLEVDFLVAAIDGFSLLLL